ncbi:MULTISPECIES: hypothetical protein [unclassified Bartonella]|uniref:hypothetical protein n=1 Tax=unclassified Bartonella TaxID=2645622 RepID=UPI0035CE9EB3
MGSSSSSHGSNLSCSPSGYWDEMKTTGTVGREVGTVVGAAGGGVLGAAAGVAATAATGGIGAVTLLSSSAAGSVIGAAGGALSGSLLGASVGAIHHTYLCFR